MNNAAASLPVLRPVAVLGDVAPDLTLSFVVDGRELFQQSFASPDAAVAAILVSFDEDPAVGIVPRTPRAVDAMSLACALQECGEALAA